MATETFNSVSQSAWQPVAWAGAGYTANELSSFLANPADFPSYLSPVGGDGDGGLTLSSFSVPPGTDTSKLAGQSDIGALLTTQGSFSQLYGYFEVTAKLSDVPGTIAALWMTGADGTDPPELDIAEVVGNSPTTLTWDTHSNVSGANPQYTTVANTASGFHTYAVDWEPDTITWYFDGNKIGQEATPADLNKPMNLVLSEESGTSGSWEGSPPSQFKSTLDVQSVRAFTSNPNGSSGSSASSGSSQGSSSSAASSQGTSATINADAVTASAAGGMQFIYNEGEHSDTVSNFNPQKDALDFENTAQSFGSAYIAADPSDGHAIVVTDHDIVSLPGVMPNQLNDQNVLFHISGT